MFEDDESQIDVTTTQHLQNATMDHTTNWHFTPDMFYPQHQPLQLELCPSNQTSYFANPGRIVKPSKRHISPRGSVKRKVNSVSALPARTRSVVDRRPTLPQSQSEYARMQNRPTSWHPLSVGQYPYYEFQGGALPSGYLNAQFTTAEVNGVITPLSVPLPDEPQIQDITTPLNELSGSDSVTYYPSWNRFDLSHDPYWPHQGDEKAQSNPAFYYSQDGYATDYNSMYNQFNATNIDTAPASPNFQPVQSSNAHTEPQCSLSLVGASAPDELVGMGLYDSPAEVQSSMLGLGAKSAFGLRGSMSKGLKLEDEFEPPEIEADDGDEPEFEGEDDEDENEDDTPAHQSQTTYYPQCQTEAPNITDQSSYFDQGYVLENHSTYAYPTYSLDNWGNPQENLFEWI